MTMMQQQPRDGSIPVFIALNFTLAALALGWLALWACVLVFGIVMSGDPPEEIRDGIIGAVILSAPAAVGAPLYAFAAFGMLKRRRWAYYVHLVGACLAAVSCIGLAYTIPALIMAQRPTFRAEFFPEEASAIPTGFSPVMPGQYPQQPYPPQYGGPQYPQQPWQ
jgi:hypothetical protein